VGMDFVALMRYRRTRDVVRAISILENQTRPLSAELQALWRESGFFEFGWDRAYWVALDDYRQVKWPRGPDLTAALRTTDGFFLTFGRGVCCAYHLLRWRFFLTDPRWRAAMTRACEQLADLLRAPDVALMSDFHPAYTAFFAGAGFDACLRAAVGREAEVADLADLYEEPDGHTWDSHGYWRLRSSAAGATEPDTARNHRRKG
jgi:hypothetical protein